MSREPLLFHSAACENILSGVTLLANTARMYLRAGVLISTAMALLVCGDVTAHELPELSGGQLFQHLCASCHGAAGRGDGPTAAALESKVPDLTRITVRHGGAFPSPQVRLIVEGRSAVSAHGSREMPVWGWELYAYEGEDPARRARVAELITRLVDHLEAIQAK